MFNAKLESAAEISSTASRFPISGVDGRGIALTALFTLRDPPESASVRGARTGGRPALVLAILYLRPDTSQRRIRSRRWRTKVYVIRLKPGIESCVLTITAAPGIIYIRPLSARNLALHSAPACFELLLPARRDPRSGRCSLNRRFPGPFLEFR